MDVMNHLERINPGRVFDLEFNIDPFPYTRLVASSRWGASKGSQEWLYIHWKERVRDLYEQLNYQVYDWGVPLSEPLSLSGKFEVVDNFEGRDLDNIAKGIIDCLNPSRRKDWKDLSTRQWIDDRQVLQHTGFLKIPAKEPRILLRVKPLWGREDPNLNFVEGELTYNGVFWTITTLGYPFFVTILTDPESLNNLQMSSDPFKIGLDEELTTRLWIWPNSSKGQYVAFTSAEALLLYRIFHNIKGQSTVTANQLLSSTPWPEVFHGLLTGEAKRWVSSNLSLGKASTALSKVREVLGGKSILEYRIWLGQQFDPTNFETTAKSLSQDYGTPWGSVRERLRNASIDWKGPDTDPNYQAIVQQLELELNVRTKAKKK